MYGNIICATLFLVSALCGQTQADCVFNNQTYPPGPVVTDNPCDIGCDCDDSGYVLCAQIDCPAWFLCEPSEWIYNPAECCPSCPPSNYDYESNEYDDV